MKQITLEDYLLKAIASLTKREMKALLENLEMNLHEKFNRGEDAFQACDTVKDIVARYGAIYGSMKTKFDKLRSQHSKKEDQFLRAYWTYISSEGSLDFLKNGDSYSMVHTLERVPVNFNLELDSTDQITLNDALTHFSEFILTSSSPIYIKKNATRYFRFLSGYAVNKMNHPLFSKFKEQYGDTVIIGKNFKVEGIKKSKASANTPKPAADNQDNLKGLEEITLDPVKRSEIVGNTEGIELIETNIDCLVHYDLTEKRNTFGGFHQYILLSGGRGTGKTMLAKYAMTLAKDIAEKNGKQLSLVKLNFEDRWQCGPLENLRNQLTEISEGNRIYIVFVDEFDTKIPSRTTGAKEGYKNEVVGEFLRFRGGGDYINRGNYVMICTTNVPSNLDTAILNVFKLEKIPGPVTKTEKVKVLYNNLEEGISQGYVNVDDDDWETIGNLMHQNEFSGRDIVNIANDAKQKYRKISKRVPHDLTASEQERMTRSILSNDGSKYITTSQDIIKSVIKYMEKVTEENMSYLK